MNLDRAFHEIHKATTIWHDFREVGLDEPYYDWYYAEERLYAIRDRLMQTTWLIDARSPKQAIEAYHELAQDIACAGKFEVDDEID